MKLWTRMSDVLGDLLAWGVCIVVVLVLVGLMLAGNALLWGTAMAAVCWVGKWFGAL